jgi:hypothetical protein
MSDPTNEPSCKPIREPINDQMNDQTTHEMNEQIEVPLQQSGTHANVSQQLVPAANSEGAKVASKTAHQLPTSSHSMNNLWQCQSFVDNVLIDWWQCQMEINKVKSMKTAQRAIGSMCKSVQSRGPCHNKKSERVGNGASTQLVGFCHDNKSEQVMCSEQEQDAKHPSKIHDPSNTKSLTNNLRQCQTFVNNVSIDSWQYRMEIDDVKSQSIKWQCQINIVDLKLLSSCSIDHSRQC